MGSRTKNATRNIIWGVIEKASAILMPFITRTVLIKVLGADYLGLNSLFVSVLQVLSISELGIGTAIIFSMYKPIAKNDKKTICALLSMYRTIYRRVGAIILLVGLLITPFIPKIISGEYPDDINICALYLIYLFNTSISYFLYAYKQAIFVAHQRSDIVSKRATFFSFVSNVAQMLVLVFLRNYYAYAIIIPLATIGTNISNAIIAKKAYPELVCKGEISKKEKGEIKKRVKGLMSFKIYNVIFSSVDTIVISSFLGLTQLAIYNNYYYVQTAILGFLNIITNSITAGIGNKMVTDSPEANYKDFKKIVFMNAWITSWCAICLICLYQHFMNIWMGPELLLGFDTMLLMALYFFIPKVSSITYTYREAAGLWWQDRFRPIIAAVVNLAINIALVNTIGINGVIISTLFCSIFINIPWGSHVLFRNYFKRKAAPYLLKLIGYALVMMIVAAITYWACSRVADGGILGLIIKVIICAILPNVLLILAYCKTNEFKESKRMLKKMIGKE